MTPDDTTTERIDRFEQAWRDDPAPALEDFLPPPDAADHDPALIDLVHIDLEYRWKSGRGLPVEDYLKRFPSLDADPDVVLDLVCWELDLRLRFDPSVRPEHYADRFPHLGKQLLARLGQQTTVSERSPESRQVPMTPLSLPGYELLEEIGHGGMGVVYQARQLGLGRLVAVKFIRADLSNNSSARRRFEAESRAVAQLDHAGIVRIHDSGVHHGHPFFVMELLPGGSLADALRSNPIAPREAAAVVAHLARAVQHAHDRGIVHRDIKPANVLLGADGRYCLTDFGLARHLQQEGTHTVSGELLGSPAYMSPEQARGETAQIGPTTDVYGLGALLYECLAGRPPHQATTREEVVDQARRGEVPPPRRVNPRVPAVLERICLRALHTDPLMRYPTAAALADDLDRYLRRRGRLIRLLTAISLLALVLAVTLAGAAGWSPFGGGLLSERGRPEPGKPLSGELELWATTGGPRDGAWLRAWAHGASPVPIRNGELFRVAVEMTGPAHVYVIYHDGDGKLFPLYPWNPSTTLDVLDPADVPPRDEPVSRVLSPPRANQGWPMEGRSSLDTVFLLARRTPLSANERREVKAILAGLRSARPTSMHELVERAYNGPEPVRARWVDHKRGPKQKAVELDQPFERVLGELGQRFEVVRAIRFAHKGD